MVTPSRPRITEADNSRALSRWTARYATSRALPALVGLVVSTIMFVALFVMWRALGESYRAGNGVLFWILIPLLLILHVLLVWMSVPRWGGRWMQELGLRYYRQEGDVAAEGPLPRSRMMRIGKIVVTMYGVAIVTHVGLGLADVLPIETMQPISALYVLPFTCFLAWATRSYMMLLFPILYGLHAILVVAGVPIQVEGPLAPMINLMGPMAGYMAFAALVGHLYNRIALAQVKHYAHADFEDDEPATKKEDA